MLTVACGSSRKLFRSDFEPSPFHGVPFRLHSYMCENQFESMMKALSITDTKPPLYIGKFPGVRVLLESFDYHMKEIFIPSWVSCLHESMNLWKNKYTCPGFMNIPRKSWTMQNEYHTIDCGICDISYALELVESKNEPTQCNKIEETGKTTLLLLRLTESIFNKRKVVIMENDFLCATSNNLVKMFGVYSSTLIKKQKC